MLKMIETFFNFIGRVIMKLVNYYIRPATFIRLKTALFIPTLSAFTFPFMIRRDATTQEWEFDIGSVDKFSMIMLISLVAFLIVMDLIDSLRVKGTRHKAMDVLMCEHTPDYIKKKISDKYL
jgi:hypothetical protein